MAMGHSQHHKQKRTARPRRASVCTGRSVVLNTHFTAAQASLRALCRAPGQGQRWSAPPSSSPQGHPTNPVTSSSPLARSLAGRPLRGGPAAILGSGACAVRSGSDGAGTDQRRAGYGGPGVGGVGLIRAPGRARGLGAARGQHGGRPSRGSSVSRLVPRRTPGTRWRAAPPLSPRDAVGLEAAGGTRSSIKPLTEGGARCGGSA